MENIPLFLLELGLFAIPSVLLLLFSFRLFMRSHTYERLVYVLSFALPLVFLFSLLKVFFIIELSETSQAFLLPNLFFAILFIVSSFFVIWYTFHFEYVSRAEILGVILLFLVSFLLKDGVKSFDLFAWGLIGIGAIHFSGGLAYSKYGDKHAKNEYWLIVICVTISTTLKLLYYFSIIPLYPTIYISLLAMFLALMFVTFVLNRVSKNLPSIDLPIEVVSLKTTVFKRIILLAIIVTLILSVLLSVSFYDFRASQEEIFKRFETDTYTVTLRVYQSFQDFFTDIYGTHLTCFSEIVNTTNFSELEKSVKAFYNVHKENFFAVSIVNNKGIITCAYPYTNLVGLDLSHNVEETLLRKVGSFSSPTLILDNVPVVLVSAPIYQSKNDEIFSVAGFVDLRSLSNKLSEGIQGKTFYFLLEDNYIIATNFDIDYLLKSGNTLIEGELFKDYILKKYSFLYYGHSFEVVGLTPPLEVKKDIQNNFKSHAILTFGIISLLLLLFGYFLYLINESEKGFAGKLEQSLLKEIESLRKNKELQDKLNLLNNFIYQSDVTLPPKEFFKNLLFAVEKILPKIDKGVLWLASGNEVFPVASIGYDMEVLKNISLDKEREEKLWATPTIVKQIGTKGFLGKPEEIITKLGLKDIKETLMIPIVVSNIYMGHFSFDIFNESVHFNEDDVQIANTIAKIVSFYLQINLLLEELKKTSEEEKVKASNLKAIVELMTTTTFTEAVEDFFSKLLSFTLSLVHGGETGSVWLPYDGEMKCVVAAGFDKEKLNKIIKVDRKTHEEMSKKQKVNLIDSIGKRNLVDETDKSIMDIKHTLAGTFWVEGEYYGSLFIDTTRLDIPFKTEDFELLYAVSNFGSLFLQTRKLFKELEDELAVDSLALEVSKSVTAKEEVSSFLRDVYKLLSASFKEIVYMKLNITVEGQCKQIFVDSNNVLLKDCVETNSDFDFKAIPIVYETQNSLIEVGTLNPLDKDRISQVEIAILPIIEEFFVVKEIRKLFADIMFALAKAIDSKDPYTRLHTENVTKYAFFFGKYLNLDINSLKTLVFASILHDVGKIGVNDAILLKKEPLGKEEMEEIKKHPLKSYEIVSTIGALDEVARVVLHHHERCDGKGYPDGLKNGEIPYLSRILSIVDAFDAMTTDRPYRKAKSVSEAMEEILRNGGSQFDMELTKKFFELKDSIKEALTTDFDEILAYILKTD